MPVIKRRQTMIEALEAVTLGKLIETTDGILAELWGAFTDSELLALSSGLGVLPSSRNPWQAAAVERFEATFTEYPDRARVALKGHNTMDELTDEQKQDIARRYGVRADLVGYTPAANPAQSEAARLSAALGVNITPAQAAAMLAERTVRHDYNRHTPARPGYG